jgi:hypothetical protein
MILRQAQDERISLVGAVSPAGTDFPRWCGLPPPVRIPPLVRFSLVRGEFVEAQRLVTG